MGLSQDPLYRPSHKPPGLRPAHQDLETETEIIARHGMITTGAASTIVVEVGIEIEIDIVLVGDMSE